MSDLYAATVIRDIPDFPKPGILFKDITPILENARAFKEVIDLLTEDARSKRAEAIVAIESRGFMFGAPMAYNLGLPFVVARKLGKLPYDRISEEYALEYGTNTIEMNTDSVKPGQRAYIVDDLLATGGTARATAKLVERLGATVCGAGFVINLSFLDGAEVLKDYAVRSLIEF